MKTKINVSNYKRVESINLFGVWFNSVYNHNYYYDKLRGDLILEISDDFDTYQYYRIKEDGHSYIKEYLGAIDGICGVWGIFDKHNNDQLEVELDSEVW
jgi:hypothetical protein